MTIGERIKQIRKENKLTQVDFAAKLKIGGTSVSKLEKGENNPSDQTITLICREFGVSEDWLRTGEGEMYRQPDTAYLDELVIREGLHGAEAEMVKKLVRIYCSLKATTRQEIMERFNEYFGEQATRELTRSVQPEHNVHEWTDAEMHAELQRQLDAEKEETDESSTFFSGNSGTAIA